MNKLTETSIPQNYSAKLYNELCYDFSASFTPMMADIIFTAVSQFLGDIKSKDKPTSFVIKKANDDFIAGATIMFIPNEDDKTKAGSWSYTWTWNKDDIPSNATLVDITDPNGYKYFRVIAASKYNAAFRDQGSIIEITRYLLETISKWLDDNATDTEEIGVQLEGVFLATATVENGVIYKSLVPEGEIKKLIKDDSQLEV